MKKVLAADDITLNVEPVLEILKAMGFDDYVQKPLYVSEFTKILEK